jgi:hypothetical protein
MEDADACYVVIDATVELGDGGERSRRLITLADDYR